MPFPQRNSQQAKRFRFINRFAVVDSLFSSPFQAVIPIYHLFRRTDIDPVVGFGGSSLELLPETSGMSY